MKQKNLKSLPKRTFNQIFHKKVYVNISNIVKKKVEYGLFSKRTISPGEVIFIAKGKVVKINILSPEDSAKYPNALGLKRGVWLDPKDNNPLVYLNHSCEPNAGIAGSVTIVARKVIRPGDEITIDYSTTECDEFWKLGAICHCKSKKCRKVISSIQHLPVTIYKKYLPYIATEMQREYVKSHPEIRL